MTKSLRFDVLDDDSASIDRARSTDYEVVTDPSGRGYIIAFADSEDVHLAELQREPDGWAGDCWTVDEDGTRTGRCRGWVHHDGPCAHLWAVRSHLARERLKDDDERHSNDVERALADGGRRRGELK
ncbi:hypothetical protein [Natronomonas gomsonensis]|uniref:hypothetical protein n=1 Tax=Natronomonas gomsonensis TaxID=1046043 RepID=UPI0015BCCB9F|nr:hypothetical protein [Natronomonas gomsonensis]